MRWRLSTLWRGLAAAGLLTLALTAPAAAQTATNAFGGFSQNSGAPIDIESDTLTVYDAKKYATFSGNVKAVQGTTTLRAKQLDVHYQGGDNALTGGGPANAANGSAPTANKGTAAISAPAADPAPGAAAGAKSGAGKPGANSGTTAPQTQITKIRAQGNVIINSANDQTTTSDWALYDVPGQLVTVGGNVVLTQGKNVLKGNKLVIDLKTGESRFVNTGNAPGGNRIRALFMPKQDTSGDAKGKNGKTKDGKAKDGKSTDGKGKAAKNQASLGSAANGTGGAASLGGPTAKSAAPAEPAPASHW